MNGGLDMNIIIKKKKFIKKLIIFIIIICLICLVFSFIDKTKKLDYDTSYKNALNYTENIRAFFENSDYGLEYDDSYNFEKTDPDNEFSIMKKYSIDDNSSLFFDVSYFRGEESFSITYYYDTDIYGPGESGINTKIVMEILKRVSGYDFSEEYISDFIENALKNGEYDGEYNLEIYDSASIGFFENWRMRYSIQEDNSVTGYPHPKYNVEFWIGGLTKTGTK